MDAINTLRGMSALVRICYRMRIEFAEGEGERPTESGTDNSGSGEEEMMCPELDDLIATERYLSDGPEYEERENRMKTKVMCPECDKDFLDEDSNGVLSCMFCGFEEEPCDGGCSL